MVNIRPRWSRRDEGAGGLMGHGGDEGARSHGGVPGSKGRGGVRDSEAGDKGCSSHDAIEHWQTRSDPTI